MLIRVVSAVVLICAFSGFAQAAEMHAAKALPRKRVAASAESTTESALLPGNVMVSPVSVVGPKSEHALLMSFQLLALAQGVPNIGIAMQRSDQLTIDAGYSNAAERKSNDNIENTALSLGATHYFSSVMAPRSAFLKGDALMARTISKSEVSTQYGASASLGIKQKLFEDSFLSMGVVGQSVAGEVKGSAFLNLGINL